MHAARGIPVPSAFHASLLALGLSSGVDIHGTKLIPNRLPELWDPRPFHGFLWLGQGRRSILLFCYVCVVSPACACLCSLSRALSLAL